MGKTHQPLTIWVPAEWWDKPEVNALREKGHNVFPMNASESAWDLPDLILHQHAHAWDDKMWPMLDVALKAARARKYPKKKEKK